MTPQPGFDFAHTPTAETHRQRKAHALAVAARSLGLQPYEIAPIGGAPGAAEQRARVRRLAKVASDPSVETWQVALGRLEGMARSILGTVPCPGCGFPVLMVRTEAGKPVLIDPFPHPDGTVWPIASGDGQRARVLGASARRPDDEQLYRQHLATCPARRLTPQSKAPVCPVCPVCRQPLNADLAARDPSYTTHPTCDPGQEVRRV